MKKQFLVGFLGLAYLLFCSSGFAYLHVNTQEKVIHFTHQDGHSDEYHSDVPAKTAIKAFFAKKQVKPAYSIYSGLSINPVSPHQVSILLSDLPAANYMIPPGKDRYIHHCTFLL